MKRSSLRGNRCNMKFNNRNVWIDPSSKIGEGVRIGDNSMICVKISRSEFESSHPALIDAKLIHEAQGGIDVRHNQTH